MPTKQELLLAELEARRQDNIKELKKEMSRKDFRHYIDYVFPNYIWSKWNRILCRILNRIEKGEIGFLLLMVSPRWGKTELVAKQFPAYVLGQNEWKKNIITSYGNTLAEESARHCFLNIQKEKYKELFEVEMSRKKEAGNWETKAGGGYFAAGEGGALTGKGFDIGIIDDYVKDEESAESLTIREKTWGWFKSTFESREEMSIQKKTSVIVFATRWNVDDLGGRLLERAEEMGDNIVNLDIDKDEAELEKDVDNLQFEDFVVFRVPAINEEGETNFPERFSIEQLLRKKLKSLKDWEAQYMQDPIKAGGVVFRRETFKYFAMSDIDWNDFTVALHIDPAWSTKKTSDDLGVAVTARHKITKEIFVLDIFGEPLLPSLAYPMIMNWAEKWKQFTHLEFISVEKVTLSKDQGEWITGFEAYCREQGKFYTLLYHEPRGQGKKEDRIKFTLEPMFNRGAIHFRCDDIQNQTWRKLEVQLLKFPVSPKIDCADVVCQGVIMWDNRRAPAKKNVGVAAAKKFYQGVSRPAGGYKAATKFYS